MPAAKNITFNQRETLKCYLERLSGIRIDHIYKCIELSSYLKKHHKISVSESTLKRIFGLVKSTDSASVYTLNLLVSAFGFFSWKSFIEEVRSVDIQTLNMLLIRRMAGETETDINCVYDLKQLDLEQWTTAYQLHLLIDSSIKLKDEGILSQILYLSLDTESIEDKLFFALQPIAVHAEQQNKFIIEWVKKHIHHSEILQKYVLQGNVFDTKLLDFYGEWLIHAVGNCTDDMPLFKSILLCHRSYLKHDLEQAEMHFNDAKFWQKQFSDKAHPILKGRIAAWENILCGKIDLLNEYYQQETALMAKIELLEFSARLIWQHKDESQQLPFINDLDLEQLPVFTNFYQKGRADVMKLVKAINHFNANKIADAKNLLRDVDPINFHFSDRVWLQKKYQQILCA